MSSAPIPRTAAQSRREAPPELVYLVAPGGNPNYGDEFILRAWLRHLARTRPEADVVVDCHTPGQAAVLLRGCHPRATYVDTVWRICFETAALPPAEAVALAGAVVGDPGRMPRIVSGIELLARADVVHLVGGGYINMVWSHHLALLATAGAAVARSGGRAVATGQGLLPLGDADRLALLRELTGVFTRFDVRDAPSQAALPTSAAVSYTGDDAWLGVHDEGVYDTDPTRPSRDFVFCLQSDLMDDFADGQGTQGLAQVVERLIADWGLRGEDVAFVEGIPGADRLVFDRVAHLLPGVAFVPFTEVWTHGLPARAGQTWVTTRFHHHLLAAAAGAAGIALSGRRDYYAVKHQSLVEAGSGWQVLDSGDLPSAPPLTGGFPARTAAALRADKAALAADIYPLPPSRLRKAAGALRSVKWA